MPVSLCRLSPYDSPGEMLNGPVIANRVKRRTQRVAAWAVLLLAVPVLGSTPRPDPCESRQESSSEPRRDSPKARITAPAKASAGDLVVLDGSESAAEDFAWVLANADKSFLPVEGGKKCVFASGEPGLYLFVLAVSSQGKVSTALHRLEITERGGPSPSPGPNPGPTPGPGPDLPSGRFGLARFAFDAAMREVAVDAKSRRDQGIKLAESLRSIAASIAAGALTDAEAILEQTRAANNAALGVDAAGWSGWARSTAEKLETLDAESRLPTPADYAEAWRELATGLEALRAAADSPRGR